MNVSGKSLLSEEDTLVAILKYGKNGDIVAHLLSLDDIEERTRDLYSNPSRRIHFTQFIMNTYDLWERYGKVIKDENIPLSDVDDHEYHPSSVSYHVAAKVCEKLEVGFW